MKNVYIVTFNEQDDSISSAAYLGKYENISDAKESAFSKMGNGDMLIAFEPDLNPEYTNRFGFETVDFRLAKDDDKIILERTDGSMDNIPEGLYYWSDDDTLDTFYTNDGKEWDGIVYELRKNTGKIMYKDHEKIKEGCTLEQSNPYEPDVKEIFFDKNEALEALKDYKSEILITQNNSDTYYKITEYYIQMNDYVHPDNVNILEFTKCPYIENESSRDAEVVGIVDFANGEHIEYMDKEEYLKCIREEIEYASTSGFRYKTLSTDPELRKAVDDEIYNIYGENNPHGLEYYQNIQTKNEKSKAKEKNMER